MNTMTKSKEDVDAPSLCPGNKSFKWVDENGQEIKTEKENDLSALREIIRKGK